MMMLLPFSDPANGVPEPPGDFKSNYRYLKKLINRALKEGTPIEELHLIPRQRSLERPRKLSQEDLIKLLHTIRRIKNRCQALLQPPVPRELERDILAKPVEDRLPWEAEALEKIQRWHRDVKRVRAAVQKELNDHLKRELFQDV
jgi:hypothetical protein